MEDPGNRSIACSVRHFWRICGGAWAVGETPRGFFPETFVIAARQFESLNAADSPKAWLFGVARNLARGGRVRRGPRRAMLATSEEPVAPIEMADDERLDAMRVAIDRLPDVQRTKVL